MREELERVLSDTPDGEARLRMLVSNYMDAEGGWPTGRTADFVARTYLHRMSDFNPRYSAMGLSAPVIGGLAGAAVSVGAGRGAVALTSGAVMRYGEDVLAYSMGVHPQLLKGIINVYNRTTALTDWPKLGFEMGEPTGIGGFIHDVLGKSFEREVRKQLTGLFADVAWRGARSALHHIEAETVGDRVEEVPWVVSYLDRFISSQMRTHERTVNHVIEDSLQRGMPETRLLRRLRETWHLAPRMAQAVTNHERALIRDKVPANRRNRMMKRYLDRVTRQRAETISTTESITLFNMARDRAWQSAVRHGRMPVDTSKMWVTERDELVCEICKPMDGQTTPLGETFVSSAGNPIVPAVHPNCRCQIIPVRQVVDVSGSEFIFPATEVTKHLGGPDGTDPHPSGTPQSVHASKSPAEEKISEIVEKLRKGAGDTEYGYTLDAGTGEVLNFREGEAGRLEVALDWGTIDRRHKAGKWVIDVHNHPDDEAHSRNDVEIAWWDVPMVVVTSDNIYTAWFDPDASEDDLEHVLGISYQHRDAVEAWTEASDEVDSFHFAQHLRIPDFAVSKHLIGRHDQKSHGREQHGGSIETVNVADGLKLLGIGAATMLGARFLRNPHMFREMQRWHRSLKTHANPLSANERQLRAMFDGFEHKGMATKVRSVLDIDGRYAVSGDIIHQGENVGVFMRTLAPRSRKVHHDLFSIEPPYQGRGFGTKFNEHMFRQYRENGYESIELLANLEVGGYAWAKQGFRPKGPREVENIVTMARVRAQRFDPSSWSPRDRQLWNRVQSSPRSRSSWDNIMEMSEGAQKELLLDSHWEGVLNLARVAKHMGGEDGKQPHPSGTPQSIHAGYDAAISDLKEGAYDMPMDWLTEHVRGSGIRIGQRNRIKALANSILEEGFTKPITLWVYEDGPFIRDGMHRLEAAHQLGLKRVPVALHHVEGNRPKKDLRGRFHAWRIRREGPQPKRDTPFDDVKDETGFVRWFNQRQAKKGERIAETPPKKQPETAWERLRDLVGKADDAPVRWMNAEQRAQDLDRALTGMRS